ncbi:MAG: glycosyltransferase family 2 protein [Terriglobales bacterium]
MDSSERLSTDPTVSIIVPARNEEACLGRCLESLVAQTGVSFEIIVVNDGSTDRTGEIAESFAGVRVINAPPLRAGWTGKNSAVFAGANEARGAWLLFTDADTVHYAGSLARAIAEAQQHSASLLSYSPEQEVHSFWEKALMPVIFAELAATYRPAQVSDPASPAAAANGQYLLITRDTYDAVGGHKTVASNLLEDVDLARAVKASGRKLRFRYGGDAVRTRMYRSIAQLREGWTKNLALLFPSPLRLAALRFAEFTVFSGTAIAACVSAIHGESLTSVVATGIAASLYSRFLLRIRKAHFRFGANLLSIFGLPLFSYLLIRSQLCHKKGQVNWKGRTYQGSGQVGTAARGCPAEQSSASVYS